MVQHATPDATGDTDTESTGTGWVDQGSGSNLHLAIDDDPASADDGTTFIQSTDGGEDEGCLIGLSSVSAPGTSGTYIKYKALTQDASYGGQPGLKLELLQGGSVLSPAVTVTNSSVSTSSYTSYTSSALNVSGISDWTDLNLRITMTSSSGMGDYMRVTQAYLETQDAGGGGSNAVPMALNTYQQMRGD